MSEQKYASCLDEYTLDELRAQAETYRDMFEIATKTLGYPSILEALEAAPKAPKVRMRSTNGGDAWVYQGAVAAFEDDGWTVISDVVSFSAIERIAELEAALAPFAHGDIDVSHTAVVVNGDCCLALEDARAALSGDPS